MKFSDIRRTGQGYNYKVFWFTPEGKFLTNLAPKVYYNYEGPRMANGKRNWTRHYEPILELGQMIVKYVIYGRRKWWEVWTITNSGLERQSTTQGTAPWMVRTKT